MRFAITHPMITHPYDPELVSGAGIVAVAAAAEAAGFHGFGFTDHPAPSQRWLDGRRPRRPRPVRRPRLRRGPHHDAPADPQHRRAPLPQPVRRGQGRRHARPALGRALHPRRRRGLPQGRVRRPRASTTPSATSCSTRPSTCSRRSGPATTSASRAGTSTPAASRHPRPVSRAAPADLDRRQQRPGPPARRRARRRLVPVPGARRWPRPPAPSPSTRPSGWPRRSTTCARRLDAAGRDPATVDITFSNPAGGDPASDAFDADAHLEGLDRARRPRRHLGPGRPPRRLACTTPSRPSSATAERSSPRPDAQRTRLHL